MKCVDLYSSTTSYLIWKGKTNFLTEWIIMDFALISQSPTSKIPQGGFITSKWREHELSAS